MKKFIILMLTILLFLPISFAAVEDKTLHWFYNATHIYHADNNILESNGTVFINGSTLGSITLDTTTKAVGAGSARSDQTGVVEIVSLNFSNAYSAIYNLTFCGWFQTTAKDNAFLIDSAKSADNQGFFLRYRTLPALNFVVAGVAGSGEIALSSSIDISTTDNSAAQLTHICGVINQTPGALNDLAAILYVNGTRVAGGASNPTGDIFDLAAGNDETNISLLGRISNAALNTNGRVDELIIVANLTLGEDYIKHHFNLTSNNSIVQVVPAAVDSTNPSANITNKNTSINLKFGDLLNITATITDETALSKANITFNLTGKNNEYAFQFTGLSGTSSVISQNITINLTRGNVINATVFVVDSSNNIGQNSTLITITNTNVTSTAITNVSDKNTNRNLTLNFTASTDADSDQINYTVYFEALNPPTVIIARNISVLNITTNMTTEATYFLLVESTDGTNVINGSSIWNVTLDTTNPLITTDLPSNGTAYNADINITVIATDNNPFEANCSVYNISPTYVQTLVWSNITTNITGTTMNANFTINTTWSEGSKNVTCWFGDTKNKNLPIDYVKAGFDGTRQQFNDTNSGLQINLTWGIYLPNDAFLTIDEDDLNFQKKSAIKNNLAKGTVENYEMEYNVTLPTLASLKLLNPALSYSNINFAIQIKSNNGVIEVQDGLNSHILIGSGKNKLSFDAQDLKDNGFTNTRFEQQGSAWYLLIPPVNNSYFSGQKFSFVG